MAQAGLRVVLVDGDLRRPSVHKIFNLPNRMGITNLLLQASSQWDNSAQPTQIPNLSIISTGSLPPNPSELLGSDRFRQFLDKLISSYDLVIVDSPPLLAVTDAAIIARSADAALLVIDSGSTKAGAVTQSREQLTRVGARVLGAVMNKFNPGRRGYSAYYQYYQYYYYGGKGSSNGKGSSRNGRNGSKSSGSLKRPVAEAPTGPKLN
jgi:capsular exopolysaccharide synthesis family protein